MIINDAGDLLEATALYIEEHGWIQGEYRDTAGRVCVVGALEKLEEKDQILIVDSSNYYTAISAIRGIIHTSSITVWNDRVCQSQEQAVDMLRHAAKLTREVKDAQS